MDMDQAELQAILEEFVTEAEEGLEELEQGLIKLEEFSANGDTDLETIDVIFRTLHTLKGGAGFLGLDIMQELAHAGENLLDEMRAGKVSASTRVMNALFTTNDLLKDLLSATKHNTDTSKIEIAEITAELKLLALGETNEAAKAEQAPATEASVTPEIEINADLLKEIQDDPQLEGSVTPEIEINADLLKEIQDDPQLEGSVTPEIEINADLLKEIQDDPQLEGSVTPEIEINADLLKEIQDDPQLEGSIEAVVEKAEAVEIVAVPEVLNRREDDRREGNEERRKNGRRKVEAAETTIRVETGRLDQVMNLVGELVLARNSLIRQLKAPESQKIMSQLENSGLVFSNLELLSRVTKDLQKSVLHTRMQPIKKVFDKIPRQVRELKSKLNREINLIIEGEMTEVDKTLVEELSDPMVHLIRNALDHGIEDKETREKIGKDPEGTLIIRAFYEGNNIVIQVAEDGKGMDPEILKRKAVEKGVIEQNVADNMSDKEACRLVLEPGFSTADVISDVSGRGVGMDVVNSKITAIKGSIDIESTLGRGTTISIYVPLTLAIVQALVVRSGCEGFAIPIGSISEVVNYNKEDVHKINKNDVIELRGEVIPLFYMSNLTKKSNINIYDDELDAIFKESGVLPGSAIGKSIIHSRETRYNGYIIIVRDANMVVGVCIDSLIGQEEAVVKSISEVFDYNPAISGATITGDGSVHMILDVPYLMRDINRKGNLDIS